MSNSPAPLTSFRLTAQEITVVASGLGILMGYCHEFAPFQRDLGLYERISDLDKLFVTLSRNGGALTHRLHLDALGIAIATFGARALKRKLKRQPTQRARSSAGSVSFVNLLRKLEKYRKRARRQWIKSDRLAYQDWYDRWHRLLAAIHRKPTPVSLRGYYLQDLNAVFKVVKNVLTADNELLPDDRELRSLVRKMLRHVRRGRAPVRVKDLRMASPKARCIWSRRSGKLGTKITMTRSTRRRANKCSAFLQIHPTSVLQLNLPALEQPTLENQGEL